MELLLPPPVQRALALLEAGGYAAYAVGGCVRDRLLSREPDDWDITTSALPRQVMEVFSGVARVIPTGLQHGTLTLLMDGLAIEATTFRIDGRYSDCRRPDAVYFTGDIEKDLARRDFTVNAMAYSPERGFADPFGGREDLARGLLRCVGKPAARFSEDALRVLRGVRFSSQLGFQLEERTQDAVFACSRLLAAVSAERLAGETAKLLCGSYAEAALRRYRPVLEAFLPELAALDGGAQEGSFWELALSAAGRLPGCLPLRLAALLCYISGSEDAAGNARHADKVLRRLRYDNRTREAVDFLIASREEPVPQQPAAACRLLYRMGRERFFLWIAFQRALCPKDQLQELEKVRQLAENALEDGLPLSPGELAIGGKQLLKLGVPAGRQMGQLLRQLLELVLAGECANEQEALLEEAKRLLRGG